MAYHIPEELLYTKSHEWVRFDEDGTALVGITDFAQHSLGDIVFINLPEQGQHAAAGEQLADVESVKAVEGILSPVTGTVLGVNEVLDEAPEAVNEDPYGAWIVRIGDIAGRGELLDAAQYRAHVEQEEA